MKFLSRFFLAAICFFSAGSTLYAQFVVDIPQKEFREKIGAFLVSDLSIGQTAWIDSYYFCSIGDNIFINKNAPIKEKRYDYVISTKLMVEPDNTVSVTLYSSKDNKENLNDFLKYFSIRITEPCPTVVYGNNSFVRVKSINGATTVSELMNTELK